MKYGKINTKKVVSKWNLCKHVGYSKSVLKGIELKRFFLKYGLHFLSQIYIAFLRILRQDLLYLADFISLFRIDILIQQHSLCTRDQLARRNHPIPKKIHIKAFIYQYQLIIEKTRKTYLLFQVHLELGTGLFTLDSPAILENKIQVDVSNMPNFLLLKTNQSPTKKSNSTGIYPRQSKTAIVLNFSESSASYGLMVSGNISIRIGRKM